VQRGPWGCGAECVARPSGLYLGAWMQFVRDAQLLLNRVCPKPPSDEPRQQNALASVLRPANCLHPTPSPKHHCVLWMYILCLESSLACPSLEDHPCQESPANKQTRVALEHVVAWLPALWETHPFQDFCQTSEQHSNPRTASSPLTIWGWLRRCSFVIIRNFVGLAVALMQPRVRGRQSLFPVTNRNLLQQTRGGPSLGVGSRIWKEGRERPPTFTLCIKQTQVGIQPTTKPTWKTS
jgi:hypothetical protein